MSNNDELIQKSYEMAMNNIPELLVPSGKIILNGHINDCSVKILVDTGAANSMIFTNTVDHIELGKLVDRKQDININGFGISKALGMLWYIELEISEILFPLSLIVANNINMDIDVILGINFLQAYNAQIDFKNKKLKLNETYEILFNFN